MSSGRILIRLPNWLGDLLMARPVLHALRAARPTDEIVALGTAASRLLEREQLWDQWLPWPAGRSALAKGGFAAALVLPPSFSSAWSLHALRIPIRIGFAGEWRSWLLTRAVRRPERGALHLSREYLELGAPLGAGPVELPPLRADEVEARAVEHLRGPGDRSPYLVLGAGAAYGPAKRWPRERFVELGRRAVGRGFAVLTCGAAEDAAAAEEIASAIGPHARSVAGRTSLEAQLALCAGAAVTVCNDSGLAHLAAASGSPTVAVFGSTSSSWTAPLGPRVRVVQRAPFCSPCLQRRCAIGYRCLTAISVDDVERAWREIAA